MRSRRAVLSKSRGEGATAAERKSGASSVPSQVRERQIGDLFEYEIDLPVTIRRNQSALVPIVLKPFGGRSVLLYQKEARAGNPMRCVEFENSTGLTLEGGPVTVLEQGSYVGEAMLDTLKPGERRLVAYAVELGVRVTDSVGSHKEQVVRVVVAKGMLKTVIERRTVTTYHFTSNTDKDETLFLDHPRGGTDWTLPEGQAPAEITDDHWRFKLAVAPRKTTKYVVEARRPEHLSYGLADVTDNQLKFWIKQSYLDDATTKMLREVIALRSQAAEFDGRFNRLTAERTTIHADQARIRENLTALGDRASEKELRERYVRSLNAHEDRLIEIDREQKDVVSRRDACRAQIADVANRAEFEKALA